MYGRGERGGGRGLPVFIVGQVFVRAAQTFLLFPFPSLTIIHHFPPYVQTAESPRDHPAAHTGFTMP